MSKYTQMSECESERMLPIFFSRDDLLNSTDAESQQAYINPTEYRWSRESPGKPKDGSQ